MSMTNAQAALIAAARGPYKGVDNTLSLASEYLSWLAAQDKAGPAPAPAAQCPLGFRCDEPHAADSLHHNDEEGILWAESEPVVIEKPATVEAPFRHFLPSTGARHATCGLGMNGVDGRWAGLKVTTFVRDVTCPTCKVELGL
jgi:hypothetical protein